MAEIYSARGWEIPPLPWTNLSPPFSIDPLGKKEQGLRTFEEAALEFMDLMARKWRSQKTHQIWAATMRDYAFPTLGHLLVQEIGRDDVVDALWPIWDSKRSIADDTLIRIKQVITHADDEEERERENPAVKARRKLRKLAGRSRRPYRIAHQSSGGICLPSW